MVFCQKINTKDGETVEVGALLGSISQNSSQPLEKKIITKIDPIKTEPKKAENNVVNLEIEKKTPKIFDKAKEEKFVEEEALVLTNEVEEDKPDLSNKKK